MEWILFSKEEPPDMVESYVTCDDNNNTRVLEWYEGDCFKHCSGGHWSDENGDEVKNIILWSKKPIQEYNMTNPRIN